MLDRYRPSPALLWYHSAADLGEPGIEYDPLPLPLEAAEATLPVVALAEDGDARHRIDRADGDALVEVVDALGQLVLDETAGRVRRAGDHHLVAHAVPREAGAGQRRASRLASA